MNNTKDFYVVGYGSDCDGCNSGSISHFSTIELAEKWAKDHNEWSDGIQYTVVDHDKAQEYCLSFDIDFQDIINHFDDEYVSLI